jgi:NAD-dependent DNA ligase
MGLLRRFHHEPARTFDVTQFTELRADAVVQVAGESHYQDAVEKTRRADPGGFGAGMTPPEPGSHKAVLVPEPTNKYDANAVAVCLFLNAGQMTRVGYLSRENAAAYRPVFDHLHGGAIGCDAAFVAEGDWDQGRSVTGVVLHLGTPGELMAELWSDAQPLRSDHQWVGKLVTFTGSGETNLSGVPLDRYAQQLLARRAGCEVLPRVTKKSQVVVASDLHEMTTNLLKAKEYGLPVVTEVEFWQSVGVAPAALTRAAGQWTQGRTVRDWHT